MPTSNERTIRWAIWGFALTGLFFGVGALIRGPIIAPIHPLVIDQRAFSEWVTAPLFVPGMVLIMISLVPDVLGAVALYAFLAQSPVRRLTLVGAVMTVVGDVLYEPYLGLHAFAWPQVGELYLQGIERAYHVVDMGYNTPAATVVGLISSLGYTAGSIVLGVAMARSRRFPRWVGPAFAVHGPLLGIPVMHIALELLGCALLLSSGVAVARAATREIDQGGTDRPA